MYLVVKNAFKRGFNKLTKNIDREISPFFFQKLTNKILIMWKKLGKSHIIKHMWGLQLLLQNPYSSKFNNSTKK